MEDVHQASIFPGLLCTELYLMQGLLEQGGIDAILADILKRGKQNILNFLVVVSFDTLHTNSEASLRRRVVEASTWAHLWRNLSLDDGLVKGRVGALKEQG